MIKPVRTTLNATTFTEVEINTNLDSDIKQRVDISCFIESTGATFIVSDTLAGTVQAIHPASTSYEDRNVDPSETRLFVKATSGTPVLITYTRTI